VPFGPPLEWVYDLRPRLYFLLEQLILDKTKKFFSKKKFPRQETYSEVSDLTTGIEFVEIGADTCKKFAAKCRAQKVTVHMALVAAHMLAYTTNRTSWEEGEGRDEGRGEREGKGRGERDRGGRGKNEGDYVDVLSAVSLRPKLLVSLPPACGGNYITGWTAGRTISRALTENFRRCLVEGGRIERAAEGRGKEGARIERAPNERGLVEGGRIERVAEESFWAMARDLGREFGASFRDVSTNIGLTVWLDEPVRDWMLRRGRESSFWGRTEVLGISNLTRVDSYFEGWGEGGGRGGGDGGGSRGSAGPVKEIWFAQSNKDATGPLLESCVETFRDCLRVSCCYCKPAMREEEARGYGRTLKSLLQEVSK
jgi:hypothetical protein